MKEYTTAEIFIELWKRIEYDADVSEQLASESNKLQSRIDKAIEYIEKYGRECGNGEQYFTTSTPINYLLDILKGSDSNE